MVKNRLVWCMLLIGRKSGCLPEEFTSLAEFILSDCPKLRLMGLMTIGKLDAPPEPYFTVVQVEWIDC